jgi:hypothetical protein
MWLVELVALCPDCPAARATRDLVWSHELLRNIGYGVLPFLITGLVIREIGRRIDRR